jgi:ATP-dependent RNA helicase DeaD
MDLLNCEQELIDERIIRAVKEMGFEQLSPIQEQAIPKILEGLDVIGQAQTGTGKTAAFGLPLLQITDENVNSLQGLVLCPTRELAIQAAEELRKFAKYLHGVRVLPIYGGQDINRQIKALKSCPQIIVGTPGRVMDHMRRHTIRLNQIKMVVLDEADEMLNMGFREDMETILSQVTTEHQTVLFSATMPQAILDITGEFQKNPELIKTVNKELTVPSIKQYYYEVSREHKKEVVARLLDYYNPKLTLIFCNTKRMVDELAEDLKGRGYFADGIHGDLSQAMRDRVMESFRNGTTDILIATDVAARGIDVDDVEAVINFDVPQDNEYYVHRIGRTGRAGRKGRAFTLVVGREIYKIREIERTCKTTMKAKAVPSVADIAEAKAQKVLAEVLEVMRTQELSNATAIIEEKMEAEDCAAIDLAAAFLKMYLGNEKKEDIPTESYEEMRKKKHKDGGKYGRNKKWDEHFFGKDSYSGRKNDRSRFSSSKDKDKDKDKNKTKKSKSGKLGAPFNKKKDK